MMTLALTDEPGFQIFSSYCAHALQASRDRQINYNESVYLPPPAQEAFASDIYNLFHLEPQGSPFRLACEFLTRGRVD